ncbi:MAG: LptA/OstA family protein, partial [Candidatus Aminicenantales bacterium]
MSARDAFLVKSARPWIAVAFTVVLAAIAFRFAARRPQASGPVPGKAVPDARKVDFKEGIRHMEYKNGKAWADVRADRFFLGEDGLNHLEGSVEIVDYGRTDGRVMRMSADKVAYDKDMVRFTISGRVKVGDGELSFTSDFLDYDKNLGEYRTDRGGAVTSEHLAGSGRTFEYLEGRDEIQLLGGFHLEVRKAGGTSTSGDISGDSLVYSRTGKKGRVEGRARVISAEGEGASDFLAFELTDDEGNFKRLTFEKGAKCSLITSGDKPSNLSIEAAIVSVRSAEGNSRVAGVEAQGNCRLTLAAPADPAGRIEGGEVRLAFDKDGRLDGWTAAGSAAMSLEQTEGGVNDFSGETISFTRQTGILAIVAKEGETARQESAEYRVEAPSITLDTGSKTAGASGGVRCLLKPRPESDPAGFFSGAASLFITSRSMTSFGGERRYRFEGGVKAWQDDGSVQAGELEVMEGTGEVRGRRGVTVVLAGVDSGASGGRRVEAGGAEMAFSPSDRLISFAGGGNVKVPGARLTAATVIVSLLEGKNEIRDLRAAGGVVVFQGRYEGRGGAARYDPAAETLVLTGAPVLVEKGKDASRGDKLTFHLGDG